MPAKRAAGCGSSSQLRSLPAPRMMLHSCSAAEQTAIPRKSGTVLATEAVRGPRRSASPPASSDPTAAPTSSADTTTAPVLASSKPRSAATYDSGVLSTPMWYPAAPGRQASGGLRAAPGYSYAIDHWRCKLTAARRGPCSPLTKLEGPQQAEECGDPQQRRVARPHLLSLYPDTAETSFQSSDAEMVDLAEGLLGAPACCPLPAQHANYSRVCSLECSQEGDQIS